MPWGTRFCGNGAWDGWKEKRKEKSRRWRGGSIQARLSLTSILTTKLAAHSISYIAYTWYHLIETLTARVCEGERVTMGPSVVCALA